MLDSDPNVGALLGSVMPNWQSNGGTVKYTFLGTTFGVPSYYIDGNGDWFHNFSGGSIIASMGTFQAFSTGSGGLAD